MRNRILKQNTTLVSRGFTPEPSTFTVRKKVNSAIVRAEKLFTNTTEVFPSTGAFSINSKVCGYVTKDTTVLNSRKGVTTVGLTLR